MIRTIVRGKLTCILTSVAFALTCRAELTSFREVLNNPRAYHQQRVSIKGVARVQGSSFVLYQNLRDAAKNAPSSEAISVAQRSDGEIHDELDNHWVIVTGILDANRHGMWNYPCEILLENVQAQPLPSGRQRTIISGIFRNETPTPVRIALYDRRGTKYAEFLVDPSDINGTGVQNGFAEATDERGKLIVRYDLRNLETHSKNFDLANQRYYYRIASRGIETVSPSAGKDWMRGNNQGPVK